VRKAQRISARAYDGGLRDNLLLILGCGTSPTLSDITGICFWTGDRNHRIRPMTIPTFPRPRRRIYVISCPLNSNHSHRKGLVTDVSGPQRNAVPVHSPLPCLFASVKRRNPCTEPFLFKAAVVFAFACSHRVGNRATFSDSRSNFHTRVGYRTNVCRRRLASDLARASEGAPAQGALEDHHDRLPGSPPDERATGKTQVAMTILIS
jgi:hypothetical protein